MKRSLLGAILGGEEIKAICRLEPIFEFSNTLKHTNCTSARLYVRVLDLKAFFFLGKFDALERLISINSKVSSCGKHQYLTVV